MILSRSAALLTLCKQTARRLSFGVSRQFPLKRLCLAGNLRPVPVGRLFHRSALSFSPASTVQFNLADIGEGITECELVQWFISEGSTIAQFDKICEVQSDKATVEITSRYDGKVTRLHYKPGEIAKVGSPLIDLEVLSEENVKVAPSDSAVESVQQTGPPVPSSSELNVALKVDDGHILATPAVRRLSRELKVDLGKISGTGKNGRIQKEDVMRFSEGGNSGQSPVKQGDQKTRDSNTHDSQSPAAKTVLLTPIQKAMVKRMQEALEIPHFGFSDEVSFRRLKECRNTLNLVLKNAHELDKTVPKKISYMPLILKSFSMALKDFPLLNSEFIEDGSAQEAKPHLLYKPHHNIGVAIDSPQGLIVPNISKVDQKSLLQVAQDLAQLQSSAAKNQISPESFANTTISISNIGNIGGRVLHPVIPSGTVCIAAIGRAQTLPRYRTNHNGELELFPDDVVTISFSADHRVVDGATVARFFAEWKKLIEDPHIMLLNLK